MSRSRRTLVLTWLLVGFCVQAGCDDVRPSPDATALWDAAPALQDAAQDSGEAAVTITPCDEKRPLLSVDDVLSDPLDECAPWIDALHVRAARVDGRGSASLWTRRTEAGTGLVTSAAHVLSPCWALESTPDAGPACPETLHDPRAERGVLSVRRAEPGGGPPRSFWSAVFPLYNPETPFYELTDPDGLPRYDFSVYVMDAQDVEPFASSQARGPKPLMDGPLPLEDPAAVTLAEPTWADVNGGELVFFFGFPEEGHDLVASVGRVLSDQQAREAIELLRGAGDDEGRLEYDPEAEFLMEARALPGMSGGGVFDKNYAQVGVAVRASFTEIGRQYVRAVRMRYLVNLIVRAYGDLPLQERATVRRYLERDVVPE